jgi:hypothetical protein
MQKQTEPLIALLCLSVLTVVAPLHRASSAQAIDRSSFPGPNNTGVPKGTELTPYTGPCGITEPNTVIDAKRVTCDLHIMAPGVRITRSTTNRIDVDTPGASLTIEDSVVDAGRWESAALGYSNVTVRRVEVRGGGASIHCSPNCLIEDSWLHGQYMQPGEPAHLGGYAAFGWGDVTVRHNTIGCDVPDNDVGGGCSGSAQIYGDFASLSKFTFEHNLFLSTPGGFCTSFGLNHGKPFGDNPTFIVVTDNVWERGPNGNCAVYGPTTSFDAGGEGNVWRGNVWEDGTAVQAR